LDGDLPAFTAATITSPARLAVELDRVRRRGYAYVDQEYAAGVRAVAAPIFGHAGTVLAAMAGVGRAVDFGPHAMIVAMPRVGQQATAAMRACAATTSAGFQRRLAG